MPRDFHALVERALEMIPKEEAPKAFGMTTDKASMGRGMKSREQHDMLQEEVDRCGFAPLKLPERVVALRRRAAVHRMKQVNSIRRHYFTANDLYDPMPAPHTMSTVLPFTSGLNPPSSHKRMVCRPPPASQAIVWRPHWLSNKAKRWVRLHGHDAVRKDKKEVKNMDLFLFASSSPFLAVEEVAFAAALAVAATSLPEQHVTPAKRHSSGLMTDILTKGLFTTVDDVINPIFHQLVNGSSQNKPKHPKMSFSNITHAADLTYALEDAASSWDRDDRAALWNEWAVFMQETKKRYKQADGPHTFRDVFLSSAAMEKAVQSTLKYYNPPKDALVLLLSKCLCTDLPTTKELVMQMWKIIPITNAWVKKAAKGTKEVELVTSMLIDLLCSCLVLFKIDPEKEVIMTEQYASLVQAREHVNQLIIQEDQLRMTGDPTLFPSSHDVLELVRKQRASLEAAGKCRLQGHNIEASQKLVKLKMKHVFSVLERNMENMADSQGALLKEKQQSIDTYQEGKERIVVERESIQQRIKELQDKRAALLKEVQKLEEEEKKVKEGLKVVKKLEVELTAAHKRTVDEIEARSEECMRFIKECQEEAVQLKKVNNFVRGAHHVGKALAKGHTDKQCEAMKSACEVFFNYAAPHLKTCLAAVDHVRSNIQACISQLENGHGETSVQQLTASIKALMRRSVDVVRSAESVQKEVRIWDKELRGKISEDKFRLLAECMFKSLSGLDLIQRDIKVMCYEWVPEMFKKRSSANSSLSSSVNLPTNESVCSLLSDSGAPHGCRRPFEARYLGYTLKDYDIN